ncbi:MAG: hypothetical protein MJH10_11910 [Epibacterium sp.]|nr:hypothetical protein [Epibacterium sp.]NQX74252.1 hypothetical protein [Epibacterium sp.]
MKELDGLKKGSTAFNAYKGFLNLEEHGLNLTLKQIEDYYDAGLSVLDVIRAEKPNIVTEGEITISWIDEFGTGSKTFNSFEAAREFLLKADPVRQYFKKQ